MPTAWTRDEVEAIVADYFEMLSKELAGVPFDKTAHRKRLAKLLNNRTDGSIEFKHQNISAVCLELGVPYVDGYKPRSNYQSTLRDVVVDRVSTHQALLDAVEADVSSPVVAPSIDDILASLEPPPEPAKPRLSRPDKTTTVIRLAVNYLEREATQRTLGSEGERFVVRFEQARLLLARQDRLAARIEHVAEERGDGDGFDVLSFEESGRERFIEVKTTRYGKQTPFYVTRNEVRVSQKYPEQYQVYRVFSFRHSPRFFALPGAISESCQLDPTVYLARV